MMLQESQEKYKLIKPISKSLEEIPMRLGVFHRAIGMNKMNQLF
jgi:hypothetical protein